MGRRLKPVLYRKGRQDESALMLRHCIESYVRTWLIGKTISQCRQVARRIEAKVCGSVYEEWRSMMIAEHKEWGAMVISEDEKGGG